MKPAYADYAAEAFQTWIAYMEGKGTAPLTDARKRSLSVCCQIISSLSKRDCDIVKRAYRSYPNFEVLSQIAKDIGVNVSVVKSVTHGVEEQFAKLRGLI